MTSREDMHLADIWYFENMNKLVESESFIYAINIEGVAGVVLKFGCLLCYLAVRKTAC